MQFSLFGAAASEPSRADLDGVLLGGGHWVRTAAGGRGAAAGGRGAAAGASGPAAGARLSVVVADRWRAVALAEVFDALGVGSDAALGPAESGFAFRTAFSQDLLEDAGRWTRGANEGPPVGFSLSPGGLRLWAITAGRRDASGYLLATAASDDTVHLAGGAQLSRLGLAAVSIAARGGGPGWRVTSAKRLRRLAELVGAAPSGGEQDWPSVL